MNLKRVTQISSLVSLTGLFWIYLFPQVSLIARVMRNVSRPSIAQSPIATSLIATEPLTNLEAQRSNLLPTQAKTEIPESSAKKSQKITKIVHQTQPLKLRRPRSSVKNLNKPQSTTVKSQSQASTQQRLNPDRLEIQLSQRTVTLYRENEPTDRYPIAIGRAGWETPKGRFKIMQMKKNPKWINPLTDEAIPGGAPDNPLGNYWMGFWTDGRNWIGFHGTPDRASVGKAASHGCIRMYNEDAGELFHTVQMGTQVIVKP